jgi:GNAT superfamily N-acetyltransferase
VPPKDGRGTVEEAEAGARGAVARLVLDVVCEEVGTPVEPPPLPSGLVLEARSGGKTVGGLLLERDESGGGARVSWWAVQRSERGAGLGREMLRQASEWCAAQGLAPLAVRAMAAVPSAARLLWTCGFRVSRLDAATLGRRPVEVLWFER